MRRMGRSRPSAAKAALVVSCLALIAAVGGNAIAEVATTALSKQEKRQIRKIASKKVRELAGELSVNHARSADRASAANLAASATNAAQVDGISAANPFDQASEGTSDRDLATIGSVQFKHFCSSGINQTILEARTTNGGTAVYHQVGAGSTVLIMPDDTPVASVGANVTETIAFTINAGGTPRTIASGTLTLRHNSLADTCQIYGTLLGS